MASLPVFEKYDLAEFDAWLVAYVASLRKRCQGWWEEEHYERMIARVSERAELVRKHFVSGEVVLRPMPPPRKMPRYAMELVHYLDPPPKAAETEAGGYNRAVPSSPATPQEPEPEITVLCVPIPPAGSIDAGAGRDSTVGIRWPAQASSGQSLMNQGERSSGTEGAPERQAVSTPPDTPERRGPGAPKKNHTEIRQEFGEVFDLERQGLTDQEIARRLGIDEKTIQRRRARYGVLHQRGEAVARP